MSWSGLAATITAIFSGVRPYSGYFSAALSASILVNSFTLLICSPLSRFLYSTTVPKTSTIFSLVSRICSAWAWNSLFFSSSSLVCSLTLSSRWFLYMNSSAVFLTLLLTVTLSNGFLMKSVTPISRHFTSTSLADSALMTITGILSSRPCSLI